MNLTAIGMQGLGLLARKGLLALSFLLVARELGPQFFGQYSYAFTFAYMFYAVSSLGLSAVTTREIARSPTAADQLLKVSMLVRICCAGIAGFLVSGIQFLPRFSTMPDAARSIVWFAWLIPAYAILDQFGAYVMGFGQNEKFAAINLIQWGGFAVGTVLTLSIRPKLSWVIGGQVLGMWLGVVFACFFLRRSIRGAWYAYPVPSAGWRLLKEAIPLAVTTVLGILYFRIGTLLLFRYAGAHETGLFTSSLQVVEALQLIPSAIVGAMFPAVCSSIGHEKRLTTLFKKITSCLVFISLFLATTGTVLSETIVRCIFGAEFVADGALLRLLIWAVVPNFLAFTIGYFLIAMNRQVFLTVSASIGVVVSIISNRLLIPGHGALGAVYSSVFTESCICILCAVFVLRYIRIGLPVRLASIAAAGTAVVWALGTIWNNEINATLSRAAGFGTLSLGLFASGFLFYRSLAARVEVS